MRMPVSSKTSLSAASSSVSPVSTKPDISTHCGRERPAYLVISSLSPLMTATITTGAMQGYTVFPQSGQTSALCPIFFSTALPHLPQYLLFPYQWFKCRAVTPAKKAHPGRMPFNPQTGKYRSPRHPGAAPSSRNTGSLSTRNRNTA